MTGPTVRWRVTRAAKMSREDPSVEAGPGGCRLGVGVAPSCVQAIGCARRLAHHVGCVRHRVAMAWSQRLSRTRITQVKSLACSEDVSMCNALVQSANQPEPSHAGRT